MPRERLRAPKKSTMVRNLLDLRRAVRLAEEAYDAQLAAVVRHMAVGETVDVDGDDYKLVDAFNGGSSTWTSARVHRFAVKMVRF